MTDFKTVLGEESDFPMSDHIYNIITENAELLTFRKGETLVDIGSLDPDIYIIKQGIVRGYMVNDGVR